ncbi:LytTR family DNA-binding domain-containing protein [uncultured Tateyamaria sp.]|uniref:LytTR family DNA-binding domain-containing protein n=1 Tax=Tateyamaria sp. 1078 TaxID=3417464 RepID=UPI00261FFA38|nr:LytTR family DNA-binding domain-containing protein [uncultured Tateyamaria sp.]
MNNSPLQLAMREMRRDFQRPVLWVALGGVGLVLAFAGAFGTADVLRPVPLVLYWISVVILTYCAGALTVGTLRRALPSASRFLRLSLTGLAVGLVVMCIVAAVNTALFGTGWLTGGAAIRFAVSTLGTACVVTIILEYAFANAGTPTVPEHPALLSRLPVAKRGPLLSLSAVDHYVEVTTTKGTELVLIRLADAIAETQPTIGLRIHRSHWIARDHVASVARGSGKATVRLSDGRTLPVSRSNLPRLKEHGLLPD